MTALSLEEFANDLVQNVLTTAEAETLSPHDAFAEQAIGDLEALGLVDEGFLGYYKAHGIEASAYGFSEAMNTLDIFLVSFRQFPLLEQIGKSDLATFGKRLVNYLARAAKGLSDEIDPSADAHDMALAVAQYLSQADAIRAFIITNDVSTVTTLEPAEVLGKPVTFEIWDLRRIHRLATSGVLHEPIQVDFDPPLPCLSTPQVDDDYAVFLTIIPGEALAKVYSEFGNRLLELNVRSFLQLKGAVNRGIRDTLIYSPERFLAYNNGISATASRVDLVQLESGGQAISSVHDLQIVNGGQTTASIHSGFTKGEGELSKVLVQMKLTQVNPKLLDEIVPEISRYSNTQNKVTIVDFSSNHPYHVELEKLSRTLWAPAMDGTGQETKWFYERARGQYADLLNKEKTPARQKKFKLTYPPKQKFAKTDVAKWENSWGQLPHLVSRGAEKNFRAFMDEVNRTKSAAPTSDVSFVRRLIAKGILFKECERVVTEQQFGGYRANIVTYAIAKLSKATEMRLDFDKVWRDQSISDATEDALRDLSKLVFAVISDPPKGTTHIGEWTKKEACWSRVQEIPWTVPLALTNELLALGKASAVRVEEREAAQTSEESALIHNAMAISAETWFALSNWAKETANLQPWQRSLAYSLGQLASRGKVPSPKQANRGLEMLGQATKLGFRAPS